MYFWFNRQFVWVKPVLSFVIEGILHTFLFLKIKNMKKSVNIAVHNVQKNMAKVQPGLRDINVWIVTEHFLIRREIGRNI